MSTKKKLPTSFQEGRRGYTLDIGRPGRLMNSASTAESCLATMSYSGDNTEYAIVARYKDEEIGRGRYKKRGPSGRVDTVETLEASGAMSGLIEAALAKLEETRQAEQAAQRIERVIPLQCALCGHALGYDPADKLFTDAAGRVQSACPNCGAALSLEALRDRYMAKSVEQRKQMQETEQWLASIRKLMQ